MPARSPFRSFSIGSNGPAVESFPITPSNSVDLATGIRAITINTGGTISWVSWEGVACTTGPLPAGTYPLTARRINAAGTTASGLTGWV